MGKKKVDPLDRFFDNRERYRAKSKKEGMVIVAACLAAAKVYASPVYDDHFAFKAEAVIRGRFIPLDVIKENLKVSTVKEVLKIFPFAEDAYFSQVFCVNFRVNSPFRYKSIVVEVEGKLIKGKIDWKIKSVAAPYCPEILTEEELSRFS